MGMWQAGTAFHRAAMQDESDGWQLIRHFDDAVQVGRFADDNRASRVV